MRGLPQESFDPGIRMKGRILFYASFSKRKTNSELENILLDLRFFVWNFVLRFFEWLPVSSAWIHCSMDISFIFIISWRNSVAYQNIRRPCRFVALWPLVRCYHNFFLIIHSKHTMCSAIFSLVLSRGICNARAFSPAVKLIWKRDSRT